MSQAHSGKEYDETMALIDMNHLRYEAPESVCATANSNRQQINFNPNAYSNCIGGEQPSLLFNVGSSYTDGQKSMIQLTLTVNATSSNSATDITYFAFGNNVLRSGDNVSSYNSGGSILNLISEVNHQSKSGELLYRELYKNQTQTTSRLYKIDKTRRGYLGVMGAAQDIGGVVKFPLFPVGVPTTFEIPLCELSSFFNTSQLIPPMLLSGSLMRLTLAPPLTGLVFYTNAGNALTTGTITNVSINLKSMVAYLHQSELYDSVNSLLLSSANSIETNGLQYAYNTQFNTIYNPTSATFNFDIQLSAAKISSLVLKFIPKNAWTGVPVSGGTQANKLDPIAAANICDLSTVKDNVGDPNSLGFSVQVRLGNLVMPLFPVSSAVDMFQQTVNALNPISFSGCDDPDPLKTINKLQAGCIDYSQYTNVNTVSSVQRNGTGTGGCLFGFSFERASAVNIGGLSSNNARILSVEVQNMANAANFQCIASVTYLQIANVSVDNVVINK
jgi:hypothetical protein